MQDVKDNCPHLTYPLHLASWWPLRCWAHSWSAQLGLDTGHGGDTHTRHSLDTYIDMIVDIVDISRC